MMFVPMTTPDLVQGLNSPIIAALDLPEVQFAAQAHNFVNDLIFDKIRAADDKYLQFYMQAINRHLGAHKIAGLDLAAKNIVGVKYRRNAQGRGLVYCLTRSDGNVLILKGNGLVVMDINPRVFCRVVPLPQLVHSVVGPNSFVTNIDGSTKVTSTEMAVGGKFQVFKELPGELQSKIWEIASREYEGRTVSVIEVRIIRSFLS